MTALIAPRQGLGLAVLFMALFVVVLTLGTVGQMAEVCAPVEAPPLPAISMPAWPVLMGYHASIVSEMQAQGVELDLTNGHALREHGLVDVELVRDAMVKQAARDAAWWNRPPCKDGRFRYVLGLADGRFAVWVLERLVDGTMREVTAFLTKDTDYLGRVRDNCGNGPWFGHSYS